MSVFGFKCLQIGNADLVGNKFNGHNLSIYLQEYNIESKHLVSKKLSKAQNTYVLRVKKAENYTDDYFWKQILFIFILSTVQSLILIIFQY